MIELVGATIAKIHTLSDRTLRITLDMREMNEIDMAILMSAYMKGEEGFSLPEITANEEDNKSPAQRLRAVIFKHWELNTSKSETFEVYYRSQMERIINTIKDKLP